MSKEIWKNIIGYEGLYQISNMGRVKRLDKAIKCKAGKFRIVHEKILSPGNNGKGYLFVGLVKDGDRKQHYIHILVGTYFIPNPENKPDINHKRGIKKDNRATQLEWTTKKENSKHAFDNGLLPQLKKMHKLAGIATIGSKGNFSVLKEADIPVIFDLSKNELTQQEIAEIYNVNRATIGYILNRKTWKHVKIN